MKKLLEFAKGLNMAEWAILLGILAVLFIFGGDAIHTAWLNHKANKQDAQIQKSIDANTKAAETSETNANTHRDEREQAEGRAKLADEQREQARASSNRTADPVRKARQRYEETRRIRPADSPDISDADLCAELARRNIACR